MSCVQTFADRQNRKRTNLLAAPFCSCPFHKTVFVACLVCDPSHRQFFTFVLSFNFVFILFFSLLRKEKLIDKGQKVRKIQMMICMITFYRKRRISMFNLLILNFHKRFPRTGQPLTVWCLWEMKSRLKMASRNQVVVSVGVARTCRITFSPLTVSASVISLPRNNSYFRPQ